MAAIAAASPIAVAHRPALASRCAARVTAKAAPARVQRSRPIKQQTPLRSAASRQSVVVRAQTPVVAASSAADEPAKLDALESFCAKFVGEESAPGVVTAGFIAFWYALNIGFNLINKSIFNYFPFPWTVSTIHVVVGAAYCIIAYAVGAKKASFERPITGDEFKLIFPPAFMHAAGHVAANLSFAAVAISLTHTVKTLEPVFNVILSYVFMGTVTPPSVLVTLLPIMAGVSYASAADLSFNWAGFNTAMLSNLTFGFRAVLSKKNMGTIKNLGSTAIYAWTTLISCFVCIPGAIYFEGPRLQAGIDAAVAQVGAQAFYTNLFMVGLLYHLYNQFAFNTLGRVTPVSHGVCNVVKRIVIIVASVIFFGTPLTMKTKIGTAVALLGTYLYTEATKAAAAKKAEDAAKA